MAQGWDSKPFSPRELVARVPAVLRRPRMATAAEVDVPPRVFGPLRVDTTAREVSLDGRPVALTRTEFDILAALSGRSLMAFSRRVLIDAVWGQTWVGDEHLVEVHIGHLRRKLGDDPTDPKFVRTVRGIGYRMGAGE